MSLARDDAALVTQWTEACKQQKFEEAGRIWAVLRGKGIEPSEHASSVDTPRCSGTACADGSAMSLISTALISSARARDSAPIDFSQQDQGASKELEKSTPRLPPNASSTSPAASKVASSRPPAPTSGWTTLRCLPSRATHPARAASQAAPRSVPRDALVVNGAAAPSTAPSLTAAAFTPSSSMDCIAADSVANGSAMDPTAAAFTPSSSTNGSAMNPTAAAFTPSSSTNGSAMDPAAAVFTPSSSTNGSAMDPAAAVFAPSLIILTPRTADPSVERRSVRTAPLGIARQTPGPAMPLGAAAKRPAGAVAVRP
eukprot:601126-Prymnesium_polylepis.1